MSNISREFNLLKSFTKLPTDNTKLSLFVVEVLDASLICANNFVDFIDEKFSQNKSEANQRIIDIFREFVLCFLHVVSREAYKELGDSNDRALSLLEEGCLVLVNTHCGEHFNFNDKLFIDHEQFRDKMLFYAQCESVFIPDKLLSGNGVMNRLALKIAEFCGSTHNPELIRQTVAIFAETSKRLDISNNVHLAIMEIPDPRGSNSLMA